MQSYLQYVIISAGRIVINCVVSYCSETNNGERNTRHLSATLVTEVHLVVLQTVKHFHHYGLGRCHAVLLAAAAAAASEMHTQNCHDESITQQY